MNIRDLEYLVAVADHAHFGKAADACFVSQPALSMQIKKMEEYLGVVLLERTNKSVLLTDIGIKIVAKAREIVNQVTELEQEAKAAKDPYSAEIRLGVFPTLAPYLFPHIIPSLSGSFPKVSFRLVEEKTDLLLEKLKSGALDAAIVSIPLANNDFKTCPLFEEEFLLAVPHEHPLAKRPYINSEETAPYPILLLEDGHCMKNQLLSYCQQTNNSVQHNFQATSLEALRHMVVAGVGITLMPKLSAKNCSLLSYIPFHSQKPMRLIGLVYRESSSKVFILREIEGLICEIMGR